jgi:membrane-associated phospholipid phosphatase
VSGEHDVVTQDPGEAVSPRRHPLVPPGVLAPALAAVVCLVLTILTWRVFVTSTRGQLIEEAARIGSRDARESLAGVTGTLLGVVSVPFLVLVVGGAVVVSLVQRRWSIAIAAIVVLVGANLTTQVLQDQLNRPQDDASAIPLNSFPSGHATVAASIAATALLVVPVKWRPPVALLGALLSAGIGISTMIGNEVGAWHRGSDVVAAMLIAATWYFAVEAVLAAIAESDGSPRSGGNAPPAMVKIPLRILTVIGFLCAGLGLGALAATAVRVPITSDFGYQVAFLGSVFGVAAVACFTQAMMLRLRPHHPRPLPTVG